MIEMSNAYEEEIQEESQDQDMALMDSQVTIHWTLIYSEISAGSSFWL